MNQKKQLFFLTGSMQLFVGLGAVAAGIGFILQSNGSYSWMSVEILKKSPFEDFLIPGIVLLTIIGLGSIFGSYLSFKQYFFSGKISMFLGLALAMWISIQVYWVGWVSWLQPVYLALGFIQVILGYSTFRLYHE
ncbi:hypothetical protein [Oceanobacillus halophilus]|uniref:Uncharacterized protein n=1 Tax=Oceanobacillus halophilus TaxID=930130 RepID=A0A495ADF9_9BACI|nr:hypothetical protein [Oceanobacillus halophilus]RKQ37968.1 hypothetical protein D8M06_04005 [Oceanobacillus halophilus]